MRLNDKKRKRVPEATLSNLEDHLFLLRFFIFIMLRTLCSEVMEAKPTIFFFKSCISLGSYLFSDIILKFK